MAASIAQARARARRKSSGPSATAAQRSTYHHGNLPEMMAKAVLEVIAETGVESVSISEAARRAGVSGGAPYRHFKDREDLLVTVAKSAYERLWQGFQRSLDGEKDPEKQMVSIVTGYFEFGRDEPGAAELLFHSGITIDHRDFDQVSRKGYDRMMEIAGRIAPRASEEERRDFVMGCVSVCYGSARMLRDRFSPVTKVDEYPEVGRRAIRLLIEGFKAGAGRAQVTTA